MPASVTGSQFGGSQRPLSGAKSKKFSSVGTRLDTGPNMRKVLAQYEHTSGPNAHRTQQKEFYAKLKPLDLAALLQPAIEEEESVYKLDQDDAASMVSSVVPSHAGTEAMAQGNLMILDVRPFEKYEECHIFGARHYDPAQLAKATNNFPRELYYFKGPMGGDKMVLLYDEDGRGVQSIANTFVERGVENTYILSGGLLGAAYRCPEVLVGMPPSDENIIAGLNIKPSTEARGLVGGTGPLSRCNSAGSTRTQDTSLSIASQRTGGGAKPWK